MVGPLLNFTDGLVMKAPICFSHISLLKGEHLPLLVIFYPGMMYWMKVGAFYLVNFSFSWGWEVVCNIYLQFGGVVEINLFIEGDEMIDP